MKINILLDSVEELYMLSEKLEKLEQLNLGKGTPAPAEEEKPKPEKPKKAKPEPEPEPVKEEPEELEVPEAVPDVKKLTVEVRALLKQANKAAGENLAKKWISNLGYANMTEVTEADDLLALKGLAEEVLNA